MGIVPSPTPSPMESDVEPEPEVVKKAVFVPPAENKQLMPVSEMAVVYAAIILADDDLTITADKLEAIMWSVGLKVESYWYPMFERALKGIDVRTLMNSMVASGAGSGGNQQSGGAGGSVEEEVEEEKKVESSSDESSDDDMGFGLFD